MYRLRRGGPGTLLSDRALVPARTAQVSAEAKESVFQGLQAKVQISGTGWVLYVTGEKTNFPNFLYLLFKIQLTFQLQQHRFQLLGSPCVSQGSTYFQSAVDNQICRGSF